MLSFLNPWLLAGIAAVAVPLLIHLIRREDRTGTPFPSLMFLRKVPIQVKSHRKLRDPLLLLCRCALLVLLALAFAAPVIDWARSALPGTTVAHDFVFAVDRSYSMAAGDRWTKISAALDARIDALSRDERAGIVAFDDGVAIVQELTDDTNDLRRAAASLSPAPKGTDYSAALVSAATILNESDATERTLVVFTDLQRNAVEQTGALTLNENIALTIESSEAPIERNLSIVNAALLPNKSSAEAATDDGAVPAADDENLNIRRKLQINLSNNGRQSLVEHALSIDVDGQRIHDASLTLEPGRETTLEVPIVLATGAVTEILINTQDDDLATDNEYALVATPGRTVRVVLVRSRREPADQTLFIQTALAVAPPPGYEVAAMSIDEASRQAFEDVDVVIAGADTLAQATLTSTLDRFVRGGGGLLLMAGWRNVEPQNNPGAGNIATQSPLTALAGAPRNSNGDGARIEQVQRDHPLAGAWLAGDGRALGTALVRRFQPMATGQDDNVIATLDNGTPLLTERRSGQGNTLSVATRFARDWSSFALQPGFVGAMQASIDYLSRRRDIPTAFTVGQTVDIEQYASGLPGSRNRGVQQLLTGGGVIIELPGGVEHRLASGQRLYTTRLPGIHAVHDSARASGVIPFAVNARRAEADLEQSTSAEFIARIQRLPAPTRPSVAPSTALGDAALPPPLAWYLLLLAAIFIILETAYANRLSNRESAPTYTAAANR